MTRVVLVRAKCWGKGKLMSDFATALDNLKAGDKVTRERWNGPGQWVVLQHGYPEGVPINRNTAEATGIPEGDIIVFRPYLMLRAADKSFVPWVPTVSDVLADDWYVTEGGDYERGTDQ
jgi:Protein of unknown function (DUF2829)